MVSFKAAGHGAPHAVVVDVLAAMAGAGEHGVPGSVRRPNRFLCPSSGASIRSGRSRGQRDEARRSGCRAARAPSVAVGLGRVELEGEGSNADGQPGGRMST
jgi:hypothetical protein